MKTILYVLYIMKQNMHDAKSFALVNRLASIALNDRNGPGNSSGWTKMVAHIKKNKDT